MKHDYIPKCPACGHKSIGANTERFIARKSLNPWFFNATRVLRKCKPCGIVFTVPRLKMFLGSLLEKHAPQQKTHRKRKRTQKALPAPEWFEQNSISPTIITKNTSAQEIVTGNENLPATTPSNTPSTLDTNNEDADGVFEIKFKQKSLGISVEIMINDGETEEVGGAFEKGLKESLNKLSSALDSVKTIDHIADAYNEKSDSCQQQED